MKNGLGHLMYYEDSSIVFNVYLSNPINYRSKMCTVHANALYSYIEYINQY